MSELMTIDEFFEDLGIEDHDLSLVIFEAVMAGPLSSKIKRVPEAYRDDVAGYWKRLGAKGQKSLRVEASIRRRMAAQNERSLRELEQLLEIE